MTKPGKYANRNGRKVCFDDKMKSAICGVLRQGCTLKTAAAFVGIGDRTLYRQTCRDPQFAEDLRRARSHGELKLLHTIHEAAMKRGDWRAAAWLLAHSFREGYHLHQAPGMGLDEARNIFRQFTEAVLGEIGDAPVRERVILRLQKIAAEVSAAAGVNKQLGYDA